MLYMFTLNNTQHAVRAYNRYSALRIIARTWPGQRPANLAPEHDFKAQQVGINELYDQLIARMDEHPRQESAAPKVIMLKDRQQTARKAQNKLMRMSQALVTA